MKNSVKIIAAAASLLCFAGASHANTYTFSFSGGTDSGSGTLTGSLDSPLTGITGTIDSQTITGLSTYGLTNVGTPGNELTTAAPHVDYNGIAFSISGDAFNLYYNNIPNDGAAEGFYLLQQSLEPDPNAVGASFGEAVTFTTSVPEPASWALVILGVGLCGAAIRRRMPRALEA